MAQSLSSAAADPALSNSAARADLIRDAVQQQAEYEAKVDAINAEIREFKSRVIKGDLGFKLSDWAAIYRVSQLEVEDRDALVSALREGFQALGIGQTVDWVAAAEATPRSGNGYAEPNDEARAAGYHDGLGGARTERYAPYSAGEPGHADYMLGLADGEEEATRIQALGNGASTPRRGRGRPRKRRQEAGAEA